MELGSASVRLTADGVHIVPGPWQRLRGAKPQLLPYEALVGVSMREPQGLNRGELTLRGRRNDDTLTVRFGAGQLNDMRHVTNELWQRIRATRDVDSNDG